MDAVRARIAPLFPDWTSERIEELVCQIAEVEWRYSMGDQQGPARQVDSRTKRDS